MRFDLRTLAAGCIIGSLAFAAQGQQTTETVAQEQETTASAEQAGALRPAPEFALKDESGKEHKLSDLKGKTVVLAWINPGTVDEDKLKAGCPYITDRVKEGTFSKLSEQLKEQDAVFLAVNSTASNTPETSKEVKEKFNQNYPILQDVDGSVGQAYGAKTTPHVFVINPEGQIVYDGALNSNESPDPSKDEAATNYPLLAATAAKEGKTPETTKTKPYGCGIKYRQ